ncbi:MAG: hypothetical protein H0T19_00370 [Thermoleophilaceae bacterium]|nr:hypothetical protein [Thermoleophilaceae bacterium]
MIDFESRTNRTKELIRNGSLCAAPAAAGPGADGTLHELGPLALLVAGFAGVGIWMFHRYGDKSKRDRPAAEAHPGGSPPAETLPGHPAGA